MNLLDYSFARPTVEEMKAAGAHGSLRYVCEPSNPKCISVPEARGYANNDWPYALVYEDGASDFSAGAAAGRAKATIALSVVHGLLAADLWSLSRPIYCAVDENLPPELYAPTEAGIIAFARALGCPPAAYAPRPFGLYLASRGVMFFWELGSSSFNDGPEPSNKRIQQLTVVPEGCSPVPDVDWDETLTLDWGQFPSPVHPPPPKPLTADEYAKEHGMVQIDRAEAEMCVDPSLRPTEAGRDLHAIAWYVWENEAMHGHSDKNVPILKDGEHLYAFEEGLNAAGIAHAGA